MTLGAILAGNQPLVRARGFIQVAAAALVVGTTAPGPSLAAPASPAAPPLAAREDSYTFAFQNAEISQVVQEVLNEAGVPYGIDPAITGRISFRIEQRLTKAQLLAALEAVLSANNIAMVRNGEQLFITPQAKAKSSAPIRRSTEGLGTSGYEIVAVPLAYAQPTEVAHALEAVSAANTVLYSNDKLGLLLLGGSGSSLKAALETLKVFDQSSFQNSKIRWLELSQAQATTVADELQRIVQGSGLVGVAVIPLKRLNGVIIFGRSAESLDELSKWVIKLDIPGKEVASTLWVYHPRNTSAEALSRTLSAVLGTQNRGDQGVAPTPQPSAFSPSLSSPTSASPSFAALPAINTPAVTNASTGGSFGTGEDEVHVGVDKESNTLLVVAPPPRWVQIQRILNEIDRPPRQVLIEASILEVTLDNEFKFGVDWSVVSNNISAGSINNGTGAVGSSFPGFSITYMSGDVKAAINALGSKTDVAVVSAPKIIALDNHTARLQVGDQVPVVTQSSQSTVTNNASLVSTVDYRSTGVILTVTPRISGDDQLVLDVNQEVSSALQTTTSTINSPTIQQRRFESALVLHSGGTVALGGLISTNRQISNSGFPGLKDVPVVGALFRSSGHSATRTEMIVLLTAKIITDQSSSDRAMGDLVADMHELQSRGLIPTKH